MWSPAGTAPAAPGRWRTLVAGIKQLVLVNGVTFAGGQPNWRYCQRCQGLGRRRRLGRAVPGRLRSLGHRQRGLHDDRHAGGGRATRLALVRAVPGHVVPRTGRPVHWRRPQPPRQRRLRLHRQPVPRLSWPVHPRGMRAGVRRGRHDGPAATVRARCPGRPGWLPSVAPTGRRRDWSALAVAMFVVRIPAEKPARPWPGHRSPKSAETGQRGHLRLPDLMEASAISGSVTTREPQRHHPCRCRRRRHTRTGDLRPPSVLRTARYYCSHAAFVVWVPGEGGSSRSGSRPIGLGPAPRAM